MTILGELLSSKGSIKYWESYYLFWQKINSEKYSNKFLGLGILIMRISLTD